MSLNAEFEFESLATAIFAVADLLLWRNRTGATILLISSTGFWFLFERAGYNLLSFVSNVLLLLVAILFLWAKSATVLNRYFSALSYVALLDFVVVEIVGISCFFVKLRCFTI